jgi:hypothetical protein
MQEPRESEPAIINEKTVADFTRVVEQTGILKRDESSTTTTNSGAEPGRPTTD